MSGRVTSSILCFAVFAYPAFVGAHPSNTAHPHDNLTVKWELDGTKDGSSAHNHVLPSSFAGALQGNVEPSNYSTCWDNHDLRIDIVGGFGSGHCFIDESSAGNVVTYRFIGTFPSGAKSRIRDAFDEWSAIPATNLNLVGIEFVETPSTPDIEVIMDDLAANDGGGSYLAIQNVSNILSFDETLDGEDYPWSFSKDKSGVPSDEWHFYSVALHEVGHIVGLSHQDNDPDDIMDSPVGQPIDDSGRQFNGIDADSLLGAIQLYGQPPPTGTASLECQVLIGGCSLEIPSYSFSPIINSMIPVSSVDYDWKHDSEPWQALYDGEAGCVAADGDPNALFETFKAIISSIVFVGGTRECTILIGATNCQGPPGF